MHHRSSRSAPPTLVAGLALAMTLPAGCAPDGDADDALPPPSPGAVTAVGAPATFRGTLPCADCPGIRTEVTLEADGAAALTLLYLEADGGRDARFDEAARWGVDDAGRLVVTPEGGEPRYFALDRDGLAALDRTGQPYASELPRVLERVPPGPMAELAGTAWRFVDPAPATPGDTAAADADSRRRPGLRFGADGRVAGSDGCNALTGRWDAADDGVLALGPLAGTLMACPGEIDATATAVRQALSATAAYRLDDGELVLLDGDGAPLARLRAAP